MRASPWHLQTSRSHGQGEPKRRAVEFEKMVPQTIPLEMEHKGVSDVQEGTRRAVWVEAAPAVCGVESEACPAAEPKGEIAVGANDRAGC